MFCTAQRVVGPAGETAVSVVQYTHGGQLTQLPRTQDEFRFWTEQQPGSVVFSMLAPLQGDVTASFLDIVALDTTPLAAVLKRLHQACLALPNLGTDDYWISGPLALRFSVHQELEATKFAELRILRDALSVLASRAGVVAQRSQPIVILVTVDPMRVWFDLEANTAAFLQSVGVMLPGRVHVDHAVREQFESQWFDAYPQYAAAATGLSAELLETLGQVVFQDATTGDVLWASAG